LSQDLSSLIVTITSLCTAIANILLIIVVFAAFSQVKAAKEATKAQVLMQLSEEWRNKEIYQAVNYIHRLRDSWKSFPVNEWNNLAEEWVEKHTGKNPNSVDLSEQELWKEWVMRRTASQFLAKMGLMMMSGYLTSKDLFGVIPETGRLLAVLIPIELAIQKHWIDREQNPIAEWDHPVGKWEFNILWEKYQIWYKKYGRKYDLNSIDCFEGINGQVKRNYWIERLYTTIKSCGNLLRGKINGAYYFFSGSLIKLLTTCWKALQRHINRAYWKTLKKIHRSKN
jgi:hypothetical protein